MKKREVWIYSKKKKDYVISTRWMLFKRDFIHFFTKWKFVNGDKYNLVPYDNSKYYFKLSPKEYEEAQKLYKEKGTISYEFYPCAGLGWGVKIRVVKTDEIIDITDVTNW